MASWLGSSVQHLQIISTRSYLVDYGLGVWMVVLVLFLLGFSRDSVTILEDILLFPGACDILRGYLFNSDP